MGGETAPCWRIALEAPAKALAAVEAALQELGGALVSDAAAGRERILVQLYLTQAPDAARLTALLAAAELAAGTGLPAPRVERLAAADWVAEGERALPGLEIGPFYVHGRHVSAPPPAGAVPMLIEASLAFGSGRHASTQGCLRAFGRLHRARGVERALDMGCGVERALDMGCGSGILAIAAAKLWGCPVLAVDVDPKALVKARENARANGVGGLVTVARGRGFDCPALAPGARFGLIVENILAEPIHAMAPALLRHLAPGGVAVLSGLLAEEAATVAAAHAPLRLVERIELDGWVTLVLRA